MKYYVYFHVRKDNDEIFYIGKGSGNRAFSFLNRNQYWHNIVNKYEYDIKIIEENLEEESAFLKEKQLIKAHSPCANLTKGGEGGDTFSLLPEDAKSKLIEDARKRAYLPNSGVKKAAKLRKGKTKYSDDGLKRMSEINSKKSSGQLNPMYGKSHWYNKKESEKQIIKKKTSESLKKTYRLKPRIYDKVVCPHCGKIGGKPGMTRYHFDNCNKLNNT